MIVHFFYVGGALLWSALAAAAHRRAGAEVGSLDRGLAYAILGLTLLGLPWLTLSGPGEMNGLLFAFSLCLPAALGLSAWQAARRARSGQPEAWILAATQLFLAYALAVRWGWDAGLEAGPLGASVSLSYAGFQAAAFAPALWLPQFVQLPWIVRPVRPRAGAAAFAWWLGLSFAGLSLVLSLVGLPSAHRACTGWYAAPNRTERGEVRRSGEAEPILSATRLPIATRGQSELVPEWLDAELEALGPDAVSVVVTADAVLAGDVASLDRRVAREREAGRRLVLTLIGPSEWYRRGVPADTLEEHLALARAAAMAARRWRPEWLFPVGEASLLTILCATSRSDTAQSDLGRARLLVVVDSIRTAAPATRVGLAGFEPWAESRGADPYAAARSRVFRWAADGESPIQAVGLVLHAGYDDPAVFERRLARADTALAALAPGKRAWVLECAGNPGVSGPIPQARHLARVLRWAEAHPEVAGLCQTALVDGPERAGLVSFLGRRREAFQVLAEGVGRSP